MSIKSTPAYTQFPRSYQINNATGVNTTYTGASPTGVVLLWQAGPDGSDIWDISVIPAATVTTANQMQFFNSPDGGTTFNFLPLSAAMATYTMAQTTAAPVTHIPHPNGVPMGPTNPWVLGGVPGPFNLTTTQSAVTEALNYYVGQVPTAGTANAQTLPLAYNSAGTLLGATPATGSILDFVAGLTCTGSTTFAPGGQVATTMKRTVGALANLSAGDLTAGFRYRAVFDGTQWDLLVAQRLYFAMGVSQAVVASVVGCDR